MSVDPHRAVRPYQSRKRRRGICERTLHMRRSQ